MHTSGGLVSDCDGTIGTIAFALPNDVFRASAETWHVSPLLPFGGLLQSFPSEIDAILAVDTAAYAAAGDWIEALKPSCRIRLIVNDDPVCAIQSPWLQDRFHVRSRADGVAPEILSRQRDPLAALFARKCGLGHRSLTFELAGGNQLVGPGFRLIGAGFVREPGGGLVVVGDHVAMAQFADLDPGALHVVGYDPLAIGAGEPALPSRNSRGVAVDFLNAGSSEVSRKMLAGLHWHQYGFHIDQFVSVTGASRQAKPVLLVAEPYPVGVTAERLAKDARIKLDLSAAALASAGFSVVRNPVPFAIAADSRKIVARLFNNVISDGARRMGQDRPLVWVPAFDPTVPFREFADANMKIWHDLGYDCRLVPHFEAFVSRNGAIRCLSKVLRRNFT